MLYDAILTLKTGEIRSLVGIQSISWTRARVIFSMQHDDSVVFLIGDIEDCHLFLQHKEVK